MESAFLLSLVFGFEASAMFLVSPTGGREPGMTALVIAMELLFGVE